MPIFDFRIFDVPSKKSTLESIKDFILDEGTKRINFATTHKHALKLDSRDNNVIGWLNLPFMDTVGPIMKREIGGHYNYLFPKGESRKCYRRFDDQDDFDRCKAFIQKYNDFVFLRDNLDLSIALSMNEIEPGNKTELGEHEYWAKYHTNSLEGVRSIEAISTHLQAALEQLPFFRLADYICCVPSNNQFLKPVIQNLKGFNFNDITDGVRWKNKAESAKDAENALEKLALLESWDLELDPRLDLRNKTVLLVDDLYQSGVTLQYVALKLKEAGAKRVFGIAIVKAKSKK